LVRSLTQTARGTIINVHEYGATARLEDGSLAAIPAAEFAAHRPTYVSSRDKRKPLELRVVRIGRHATASLAHVERDPDANATSYERSIVRMSSRRATRRRRTRWS
jgi:hypothetical protein